MPPSKPVWAALTVVLAVAFAALSCASEEDVPPLERRAQELNKAIMCPVCPGESLDQSQNDLAAQMRGIIVEQLAQGWTDNQIKDFFVERYGPSVLMEPPRQGFSLMVWLLPVLGVLGAGATLYLVIRLMRRPPAPETQWPGGSVQLSDEERDEYFRRIETALDRESDRGEN